MYAEDKQEAIQVFCRLSSDGFLCDQSIYIRQFVPLNKLANGLQGLPISEEYRFFIYNGKTMSSAFYWSEYSEFLLETQGLYLDPKNVPQDWLNEVIDIVSPNIKFFVLDVAKTANGDWIVVELNDAQCSGLSDNDPEVLYKNLAAEFIG
jgi:hypothetical protein